MPTSRNLVAPRAKDTNVACSSLGRSRPFSAPLTGGHHLDGETNARMSAQFSHDFSKVKIHSGAHAAETTDAIGAQALTLGNDIAFGEGMYSPGSEGSERLLAHELTHVVQQDRFGHGMGSLKSRRSDASEQEAESAADQVLAGGVADVRSAPRAAISCFDPSYNDVKDDFWGTKSTLGKQDGSTVDSAMNTAWDLIGLTGVGGAVSTGIDLAKAGYSESMSTLHGWEADLTGDTGERMRSKQYDEAAGSFMGDAAVDATGAIPIYGTGQGVTGALWDGARTADLARGANPDGSPSFGDIQKMGGQKAADAVTPATPAVPPNQGPDPNQPPPNMPADPFQGM